MNQHSNPIDFLIEFAWANGADRFIVNNAKDELKNLRQKIDSYKVVAFGKINDRHDLYDLRIQNNPHDNQEKIVPLYSNREEFLKEDWRGYHYGKNTK